jgi:hypothetical protein
MWLNEAYPNGEASDDVTATRSKGASAAVDGKIVGLDDDVFTR